MNVEHIIATLERHNVIVWGCGRALAGTWTCRLLDTDTHRKVVGTRGPVGYDLPCWIVGRGPTMLTALTAAAQQVELAHDITIFPKEVPTEIDIEKLLG